MRTIKEVQQIAIDHHWQLSPNAKLVESILSGQNKFKRTLGEYYCPCKPDHSPANICPCADAAQEIAKTGHCHCRLFVQT